MEEHTVLGHNGNGPPQTLQLNVLNLLPIYGNVALLGIVEPVEQANNCGLAGARAANQRHLLAGRHLEGNAVQDGRLFRQIAEKNQ